MEYENLWEIPTESKPINLTENIFEIMKQQSRYLKKNTGGKIFAKFRPIKVVNPLSDLVSAVSFFSEKEIQQDDELNSLSDAHNLYYDKKYAFEIYTKTYKFRIFEMIIPPLYPVRIIIDEGITNEIENHLLLFEKNKTENSFNMFSEDELLKCLKFIFSSEKVKYILYRLQKQSEENENSNILKK